MQDQIKRHYLYRIHCTKNNKNYIGQSINPRSRWYGYRNDAASDEPSMVITKAIKKHGNENFEFEVIASGILSCTCSPGKPGPCQDNANEMETLLVKLWESHISTGKGYNVSLGGQNAPKTEEWREQLSNWHASLSPEEKADRSTKLREAILKQIEIQGHPAQGYKHEPEEIKKRVASRKPVEYTPELRQKMSEAHIGKTDSEETKQKKSESIKASWAKRLDYTGIRCNAPGCEVQGKHHYIILDGVRYCSKHGQRLRNTGYLELQPCNPRNKDGTFSKRKTP
jgi:group I intron endonuclease